MFTPGKWEVTKWASHPDIHVSVNEGSYMRFIANCGNPIADTLPTNPDAEANAHLIAAAPDMRDALKQIQKWLLENTEITDGEAQLFNDQFVKANNLTVKALAKANKEG